MPRRCRRRSSVTAAHAATPRPIQQQPARLTPEGLVPSTASLAAVRPELRPLLPAAVAGCQQLYRSGLAGVYLRGSIVQEGCFLPGISDADFIVLVVGPPPGQQPPQDTEAQQQVPQGVAQSLEKSLHRQFPQCSKIELQLVCLPPSSPLAALFTQQADTHVAADGGRARAALPPAGSIPPAALIGHEQLAFQLKTQAVCLHGWDLPRLLPHLAAVPQPHLLPALHGDVEAALRHATQCQLAAGMATAGKATAAATGDAAAAAAGEAGTGAAGARAALPPEGLGLDAARAVRWALKRCIRAAFELYLIGSPANSKAYHDRDAAAGGGGAGCGVDKVYSRDLYWCLQAAAQQHPGLQPQLTAALQLYLDLRPAGAPSSNGSASSGGGLASSLSLASSGDLKSGCMEASSACPPLSVQQQQQAQREDHDQQEEQQGWRRQQQQVQDGAALAASLASAIDRLFLAAMLAEEPGWLTLHTGQPAAARAAATGAAAAAAAPSGAPRSMAAGGVAGGSAVEDAAKAGPAAAGSGPGPSSTGRSWAQKLRVGLWAAAASASGGGMERSLVGGPPPPVAAVEVAGNVLTLDWQQPDARRQAVHIIAACVAPEQTQAAGQGSGAPLSSSTTIGSSSRSSSSRSSSDSGPGEAMRLPLPQPVVLRGAAAHWPALQWTLQHLAAAKLEGRARLSPSLQFPFTEPRLAALLAQQRGATALPSCVCSMGAAEFAARMQAGNPCRLPPLLYRGTVPSHRTAGRRQQQQPSEFYYFQAELLQQLLRDIDISSPPFALPVSLDGWPAGNVMGTPRQRGGTADVVHEAPPLLLRQTQAARVWVGPQGAISPTHYDLDHSFLTQVKGRKRMLFWSPDQLPYLYPYPDAHLLRRRSRVNMHAPMEQLAGRFPLLQRRAAAAPRQALLEPGDVVFFPSRWAHYTESLDFSMSVTCRFQFS